jgi:hypothetical protein
MTMTDQRDTPTPGSKAEAVSAIRDPWALGAAKALASVTSSRDFFVEITAMSHLYKI